MSFSSRVEVTRLAILHHKAAIFSLRTVWFTKRVFTFDELFQGIDLYFDLWTQPKLALLELRIRTIPRRWHLWLLNTFRPLPRTAREIPSQAVETLKEQEESWTCQQDHGDAE